MPHDSRHHIRHRPEDHNESTLADLLDLDAEVFGSYLDEAIDLAEQQASEPPRIVVDIGAGTGTGSLALARRFSMAEVVAIDSSAFMLERLRESATMQGMAERMRTVQADLDIAWPGVGPVDLAWAASSLHHLADPDRLLRDVYAALNAGGLLMVIELDSLPRFLPEPLGQGRPGLESRLHAAMAEAGWNEHPDWLADLERAGFEIVEQRRCVTVLEAPATPAAERHARASLSRARAALGDQLDSDDVATLDRILTDHRPDSPLSRNRLKPHSARTVWVARRPVSPRGEPAKA